MHLTKTVRSFSNDYCSQRGQVRWCDSDTLDEKQKRVNDLNRRVRLLADEVCGGARSLSLAKMIETSVL